MRNYLAIDPMFLILGEEEYLKWVEIHHPHVPSVEEVGRFLDELPPEKRKAVVGKSKLLSKYGKSMLEFSKVLESAVPEKVR